MKVLLVSPYFAPRVGGVENYVLALARGLKKLNWEVVVITTDADGKSAKKASVDGIPVHRLPVSFKISNTPVGLSWKSQITKILTEEKPQVINVHTPVPFLADIASLSASQVGIPVVVTYHNDVFKENSILELVAKVYYHLLGNRTLRSARGIIATSAYYVDKSVHLQKYKKKISIIPPGVNSKVLEKNTSIYNDPYVLFVGQLDSTHRHKGVKHLLEAFKILENKNVDVKLQIVGKGNDIEMYQSWISQNKLENKISLLGFVNEQDLSKLYANALCLCLPSTTTAEGFGMVVIEAAQQKTPSIGSDIGGISQSIQNKKTGLLFTAKNPLAISNAVTELLNSPALRNQLGEAAYQRVEKEFLWTKQIDKTAILLKGVIS